MAVPAPSHKMNPFFVRLLTDWTLREIAELFAGNGLTRKVEAFRDSRWPIGSSQRRTEAVAYLEAMDLSDERQRASLLRVYSDALSQMPVDDQRDRLQQLLEEDGVEFSEPGRIDAKRDGMQARLRRLWRPDPQEPEPR